MSEFDKEAEREKLRKKYEQDKQDREATKRMSDLLLKGATMTNTHCGTCGDPLFEQNGTRFCPSCHGSPEAVGGTGTDPNDGRADTTSDSQRRSETEPTASNAVDGTQTQSSESERNSLAARPDSEGRIEREERQTSTDERESAVSPVTQTDDTDESPSEPKASGRKNASAHDRSTWDRQPSTDDIPGGDVENARELLIEAIERFARKGTETDDPRLAKEYLDAAREASEALAALQTVSR